MACFIPKRKTAKGMEDVKLPITAISDLTQKLSELDNQTLSMPRIRLANAYDMNNTMCITKDNPLILSVEIIDGYLQEGDSIQVCTRELYTYQDLNKRKYKLKCQWHTKITNENKNLKFINVAIYVGNVYKTRLFKSNRVGESTLSPLYIRVRRPIYINNVDNNADFSNIVTVWKKYDRGTGKIQIK